jgi:pilus assembly protein CpaC
VSVWGNQSGKPPIAGSPGQYRREVDGSMKIFNNVRDAVGFFGIATMITSSINLAVNNGDALMLAEPTLSARSGGKAEFLAGGQLPIPIPQGDGKMSIEYKDYGIMLNIEPKAGRDGAITSKVTAEVSSINKDVEVQGVPGMKTRKTETEVSLRTGQTLAISGLVDRDIGKSVNKVAGLGDIPILGQLFRSTSFRNNKSELVIFITPHIAGAKSEINKKTVQQATKLREQFLQSIEAGAELLD